MHLLLGFLQYSILPPANAGYCIQCIDPSSNMGSGYLSWSQTYCALQVQKLLLSLPPVFLRQAQIGSNCESLMHTYPRVPG